MVLLSLVFCTILSVWLQAQADSHFNVSFEAHGASGPPHLGGAPAPAPSFFGKVMSKMSGKPFQCIDLPGSDTTNGNKLWVWDCNGHYSQRWAFFNNQLLYLGDTSKCVDIPGGDTTNGNQLQIWDCNGKASQQWSYDEGAQTVYLASSANANKCMDAGLAAKGTKLMIWDCNNLQPQVWDAVAPQGATSITDTLNEKIAKGKNGVYSGGKGVLVRNPMDDYEATAAYKVVPATFWTNDIYVPTAVFPQGWGGFQKGNGDPNCPNDGSNGYYPMKKCPVDKTAGESGPWNYATTAYVISDQMYKFFPHFSSMQSDPNWGYGVFYATDSNSVDQRCRWVGSQGYYDCPGGYIQWQKPFSADTTKTGSGAYSFGNPYLGGGGGGTGCHFTGVNQKEPQIDQTNGEDAGVNINRNQDCECEYKLKSGDSWEKWVDQWIAKGTNVKPLDGWFKKGPAPGHGLDQAACWVNNPRDMINLQNWIYWKRFDWSNQKAPKSNWKTSDPTSMRVYWGWNEVPIPRDKARDMQNRAAVMIKLPAALCFGTNVPNPGGSDTIACLSYGAQVSLEQDIDKWLQYGMLKIGYGAILGRPGSYIVFAREYGIYFKSSKGQDLNWQRFFYCENWVSPNQKYQIKFIPKGGRAPGGKVLQYGACYLDTCCSSQTSEAEVVV